MFAPLRTECPATPQGPGCVNCPKFAPNKAYDPEGSSTSKPCNVLDCRVAKTFSNTYQVPSPRTPHPGHIARRTPMPSATAAGLTQCCCADVRLVKPRRAVHNHRE